ncbi:mitochondrial translation release factor [Grosmannia clavigera kw1407]|uniref:Mitochondrial translation release factor n=1 Tax=Grosmannia clavigera (strain kw1407 / UAMH 11150) TaxID=655863 RepID=F0XE89_GROCL|nr:mitochondrial translation release factor [Grosmannia clavigera kw1407]EFX04653.1 mitochondrial translation release factor [Grosmannia clavigera kw1407]
MFAAPWVCRQCAREVLTRRVAVQFRRHASGTGASTMPAVLLERARRLAAEHGQLQQSLETEYDATAAKRAGEIQGVAQALAEWEEAQRTAEELRTMASAQEEDEELRKLAKDELEATEARLDGVAQQLTTTLTPKHPFGEMPCLLEFRPGPGGLEGRFFTDSLFHMYQSYCTRQGYRARVIKYEVSDSLGETGADGESALQEAVLEVQEAGAYDVFRGEAGIHRVQRIPATEKNGRTHTSAAAVWVLPSFPDSSGEGDSANDYDDPESDFYVQPADVRVETMRARGAGGQHVNKTESAIRLTHVPSGTVVSMQDSRSQHQNRDSAWKILRARIAQRRREQREEEARRLRDAVLSKAQVTRSDKIRTYNYSQDRVTDHRCGLDVHNLPDVLAGGDTLARIVSAVCAWQRDRDVEAVLAEEAAKAKADTEAAVAPRKGR